VTMLIWTGIILCISQSAMLSGLNLAFFTVSKLELEIEAAKNNTRAARVLALREDANFLLVTILWGNVSVNVLLALLSGSVLAGVTAFVFSTVLITIVGEILPQAYFSRHALRIASLLTPMLRLYQLLLFPIAKPTALVLDRWLGPEAISFFKEKDLKRLIKLHMESPETDIDLVEGRGALNFLAMDDVPVTEEGELLDPESIMSLDFRDNRPVFPPITQDCSDEVLSRIHRSGKKWIVLVDDRGEPGIVLDSDEFIRDALFNGPKFNPYRHCHKPIVVRDPGTRLGEILPRLKVYPVHGEDDVLDEDVILVWNDEKRIITGDDVLGRLLRGIAKNRTFFEEPTAQASS